VIIERYTTARYKEVLAIVRNFYEEALKEYGGNFDETIFNETVNKYKDNSFLLIIDDKCVGVLAGIETTSPLNRDKIFQEIIWYVNKPHRKYGVYFLNKAREMLRQEGYSAIVMACIHNLKTVQLFRFYERHGFIPFETHFLGRL